MTGTVLGPLRARDVDELAGLHRAAFPDFFLSRLGRPFLVQFYAGFLDDESAVTVVARTQEGTVIGAAVGSTQPAGFFRRLLRRRWRQFGLASARYVLRSPASAPRLLRAVRYRGGGDERAGALLSSICVLPGQRQLGVGARLLAEWAGAAERAGADRAFLTTDAQDNDAVNRFYQRHGWTMTATFRTPEGRAMNRYTTELSPPAGSAGCGCPPRTPPGRRRPRPRPR